MCIRDSDETDIAGDGDPFEGPATDFGFPNDAFPAAIAAPALPSVTQPTDDTIAQIRFRGALSILGTNDADTITVTPDTANSNLRVAGLGDDGTEEEQFPIAEVQRFVFNALDGDDTLTFEGDQSLDLFSLEFFGNAGDDTLTIVANEDSFDLSLIHI